MEKRRCSVPLLMTCCYQIDLSESKLNTELYIFCCTGRQKCTKLHRFAPIFSKIWSDTPDPPPYGEGQALSPNPSPGARPPSHFQSFRGRRTAIVLYEELFFSTIRMRISLNQTVIQIHEYSKGFFIYYCCSYRQPRIKHENPRRREFSSSSHNDRKKSIRLVH